MMTKKIIKPNISQASVMLQLSCIVTGLAKNSSRNRSCTHDSDARLSRPLHLSVQNLSLSFNYSLFVWIKYRQSCYQKENISLMEIEKAKQK